MRNDKTHKGSLIKYRECLNKESNSLMTNALTGEAMRKSPNAFDSVLRFARRRAFERALGALRPREVQQIPARHEQIGQRAGAEQPMGVLVQALVAHFGKAELELDHREHVLDLGAHAGFGLVFRPLAFIDHAAVTIALVSEIPRLRCLVADRLALPAVSLVATHTRLLPMQQIVQHGAVRDIGGGSHYAVDELGLAVDAHMRLHAEVPLIALFRLVHVRVALFGRVLGRAWGVDNRGIDDGAAGDLQPLRLQVPGNLFEDTDAQLVRFEQVPEVADGGLVGHPLAPEIQAHEATHRHRIVERFLHAGV